MPSEQQYEAELLRQRHREQQMRKAELQHEMELIEAENRAEAYGAGLSKADHRRQFPISTIEIGLWILAASFLDFFEWFGQVLAAIPVIGWALAGASSIMGMIFSGIMFLVVGLWLFWKGIVPINPTGIKIFLALGGTAFGNALINWLPIWIGFFIYLFFIAYKKTLPSLHMNK